MRLTLPRELVLSIQLILGNNFDWAATLAQCCLKGAYKLGEGEVLAAVVSEESLGEAVGHLCFRQPV